MKKEANASLFKRALFKLVLAIFPSSLFPNGEYDHKQTHSYLEKKKYKQWFTGPVLTPTPITLPPGHPALEVAGVALNTYGFYDKNGKLENRPNIWSIGPFVDFMAGLSERVGVEFIGSYPTNFSQGESFSHLNDIKFRLGFQILNDIEDTKIPDFRVILQESFPTGKYDNLDPLKLDTDITGIGAFETGFHLAFQKLFCNNSDHPYRIRWTIGYFFPHRFNLHGLSVYGGAENTYGKMQLGNRVTSFFSFEYSLNRKWSLAFESNIQYRWRAMFKGFKGTNEDGDGALIDKKPFFQFSVLPEIEHTFTANTGMLIGGWFTLAGSNSPAFAAGFISILHVF